MFLHLDINECELPNADVCTDELLNCVNTFGSYFCECVNPELQLSGNTCVGMSDLISLKITKLLHKVDNSTVR